MLSLDETLLLIHHDLKHVIAPISVSRVGSNFFRINFQASSFLLLSFLPVIRCLILVPNLSLNREMNMKDLDASDFRKSIEWMENMQSILLILPSLYPGKKNLITWNYAGAHIEERFLNYMRSKRLYWESIDRGLISVLQPCDLWADKTFK